LERVGIGVASLALSFGLIALLSGYFAGHDPAGVGGSDTAVGLKFKDLGHAHLTPADPRPLYNSNPPTSGAHIPEAVLREDGTLTNDQLLQALQVGDVIFAYGTPRPPAGLPQLARSVSGRFTPALAAAGQAIVLMRRAHLPGVTALAWTRMLQVRSAQDPLLRQFALQFLGRGAPSG
jgi:hypothetical protein